VEAEVAPDETVRDAASCCPVEAISLVDADTGEPVSLD
jgi:ferredoxin